MKDYDKYDKVRAYRIDDEYFEKINQLAKQNPRNYKGKHFSCFLRDLVDGKIAVIDSTVYQKPEKMK